MLTFFICYLFIGGWLASSAVIGNHFGFGAAKSLILGFIAFLIMPLLFLWALVENS